MPRPASAKSPRAVLTVMGVCAVTMAMAGAAVWGLLADRTPVLETGQPVLLSDGGRFVVQSAGLAKDPMMTMHGSTAQFARSGMPMSSMLPDAVPEGMKRITVQLEVTAGAEPLAFPSATAELRTDEGTVYHPYQALLGDERLDAGAAISGVITFEVPSELDQAAFRIAESAASVAVSFGGDDAHHHA